MKFQSKFLQPRIMYHATDKTRVEAILRDGLKINSEVNFTEAGTWAHEKYGCNPIYLSIKPDAYHDETSVLLKVNVSGLKLAGDLPGLAGNHGFMVEPDAMYLDPEYGHEDDDEEVDVDDEFYLEYEALVEPGTWEANYAIQLTQTAACLQDIPAARIAAIAAASRSAK
jgi:hypothetical protein